jgi:iron complex transport system ATP-binding protein
MDSIITNNSIIIPNLTHRFSNGDKGLFEDLEVKLKTGVNLVIGRNGSGKSSLFETLFHHIVDNEIATCSYLPQDFHSHILPWLTIEDNLKFFGKSKFVSIDLLYNLLINRSPKTLASRLSIGNSQLLGIYNCLAMKPRILILDEPLSALDLDNQKLIMENIKKFSDENGTIVIIADHLLHASLRVCDNCIFVSSDGFGLESVDGFGELDYLQRQEIVNDFYDQIHPKARTN